MIDDGHPAPALAIRGCPGDGADGRPAGFTCLIADFDNGALVARMRAPHASKYSARQATYDLRRLRRRSSTGSQHPPLPPHQHRPRVAVLFTKACGRILGPGLAAFDPHLIPGLKDRPPLAVAWNGLLRQLDRFIDYGWP